jgi:hypothetical protein
VYPAPRRPCVPGTSEALVKGFTPVQGFHARVKGERTSGSSLSIERCSNYIPAGTSRFRGNAGGATVSYFPRIKADPGG